MHPSVTRQNTHPSRCPHPERASWGAEPRGTGHCHRGVDSAPALGGRGEAALMRMSSSSGHPRTCSHVRCRSAGHAARTFTAAAQMSAAEVLYRPLAHLQPRPSNAGTAAG
eukprot:scaffold24344_cov23-Tisochrysis_lutea.AAC.1